MMYQQVRLCWYKMQRMCADAMRDCNGLTVKILRVPYLYSGTYKKDFFYKIFQASKESQKLFFREAPEQKACFLYSMDLAELMYKLFDNWNDEEEVLNVPDVFGICFQDVTEELKKGEKIQLVGFGTFEVSERAAREGRNPQSGEPMKIEASKAPRFKAGKALKDMINEK